MRTDAPRSTKTLTISSIKSRQGGSACEFHDIRKRIRRGDANHFGYFNFADGSTPDSSLVADSNGNLYGTTSDGGSGKGVIFEIEKTPGGYLSTPTLLFSFGNFNGAYPVGNLIVDANGNLFGTAQSGGTNGSGTVFELVNNAGTYTLNTLVNFGGPDGRYPLGGLFVDADGNLLGTTNEGGTGPGGSGNGTVFEIEKTPDGYASTPTTLFSFNGPNGTAPTGGLIADANGNLFGTTELGGPDYNITNGINYGKGTIFEIVKTPDGYANTPVTLVNFDGTNGARPFGDLIIDANGNLFGTTSQGGPDDDGTVFELVNTGGSYTLTTLVTFNGVNGQNPIGTLIADARGNLFGTTLQGGANGYGTVFEIVKTESGYSGTPVTVVDFSYTDGATPRGGLIADENGNLFGTTASGPAPPGPGTVFEITDSDFVPCYCRGTLIRTDGGDRAIETLVVGDLVATINETLCPIQWIGYRAYDSRFVKGNKNVLPICVRAGALGELPLRDLWVSPEHALLFDDVLVPAKYLVNGVTIVQPESTDEIEYFHIELKQHDVVFAEGAPAETFVDCDNRGIFANAPEHEWLLGTEIPPKWSFAAPRLDGDSPKLLAIREKLRDLAERPYLAVSSDSSLCLIVDGEVVEPRAVEGRSYSFNVRTGAASVQLASRAVVPAEIDVKSDDRRRLGVPIQWIRLRAGSSQVAMPHSHPAFRQGFYPAESTHRWTNGLADLPSALLRNFAAETVMLDVRLADTSLLCPDKEIADCFREGALA